MNPRVIVLQALTVPRSRFDQGPDAVRNHMGPETFNVRQAGNGETEQCVLIECHGKEYMSNCYVLIINRKTNQVLQRVEAICLKISLKISTLLLLSNTSIQILSFLKQNAHHPSTLSNSIVLIGASKQPEPSEHRPFHSTTAQSCAILKWGWWKTNVLVGCLYNGMRETPNDTKRGSKLVSI